MVVEVKIVNTCFGAVMHDGKLLLIKRAKEPYKGLWALVGGKIEFGEHPEDTAIREVKEETGLDVKFSHFAGIISEVLKEDGRITNHFICFICVVHADTADVIESDEGELRWFAMDEIPSSSMVPSLSLIHI